MKKADLVRDLERKNNGRSFISKKAIRESLRIGSRMQEDITRDLPRVGGKRGGFYVGDIAEKLMEMRR